MKRQKILIIVLLSLFVLLLCGYFFLIRPMTATVEEGENSGSKGTMPCPLTNSSFLCL